MNACARVTSRLYACNEDPNSNKVIIDVYPVQLIHFISDKT